MRKSRLWLIVLLVIAAVLASSCARPASSQDMVENDPEAPALVATETEVSDQEVPMDAHSTEATSYQGLPAGFTEKGDPYLGDPDAPITLVEYSDYLCPFCARHFGQTLPALLDRYARTGQMRFVFRDFPIASLHPTAHIGSSAASCAAEQGAALFWKMHDQLFLTQEQWGQLPDPTGFVAELAKEIGVDSTAYEACMASRRQETRVEESIAAGQALGFRGTPSFQFVRNESGEAYILVGAHPAETFSQWLDALIAGEAPPQEEEDETEAPELPFWANSEGLAPDPERPGFTMAGDPYKGNPEARLVVVEFSDFQCPACQRHALDTQPALDQAFVDSGEIMWVFKHLPLQIYPQSPAAAAAAECAADQGMFWEMYHLLFERLDQWSADGEPDVALPALAKSLDLDMDAFAACFNSRQAMERVLSDLYDAQGVAQTTPTFIMIYGEAGQVLRGARPADQFVPILQNVLEDANASE